MKINQLESAVVFEALKRYVTELKSYQSNHPEHDFRLEKEIQIVDDIMKKIKEEYKSLNIPTNLL
ncbi:MULTISPECIES: hypothetical protein [Veillonella]|uniref:hypothetical protein n=1 Tax=Veillonella TaxID=29465 RepID=UPI00203D9BCE|nr:MULTISPECIES: hypothetical protein [Veillonella]